MIAVYCRVSSDEQAERGTIENQKQFAEQFCQLHKLSIYDYYMDDGITGTLPIAKRPEGQRLLADATNKCFDTVLFYKLDRLGRSLRVILDAVAQLEELHVNIKSMTEQFDTTTPAGRFGLNIFATVAELDRETILDRMHQGAIRNARLGKWLSGLPPYGYKIVDGYLEPDEQSIDGLPYSPADVIRIIFELAADGKSTISIANHLNDLNIPSKYKLHDTTRKCSGYWYQSKVLNILHNTVYYGYRVHGKQIEQTVPAIVAKETWDKAQEQIKLNFCQPTLIKQHEYLLRGLIKCGKCGSSYCGITTGISKRSHGKPTTYYACSGKTKARPKALAHLRCRATNVKADWLEDLVWQDCLRYIQTPGRLILDSKSVFDADAANRELDAMTTTLAGVDKERQSAITLAVKGIISDEDLTTQLTEIDARRKQLTAKIADAKAVMAKQLSGDYGINTIYERLLEIQKQIDAGIDFKAKRAIVHELIDRIIVTSKDIVDRDLPAVDVDIVYKFPVPPPNFPDNNPHAQLCEYKSGQIEPLWHKIKRLRLNKGYTLKGLAERSGLSFTTISALEAGQAVFKLSTLSALAGALDIDSSVLTDAKNMPEDTLAQKLEKARIMHCHTRQQAMQAIGISNHTYMDVIKGRRQPCENTMAKIIEYIK